MKTVNILPVFKPEWLEEDKQRNPDPSRPVRYGHIDFPVGFWRKLWLYARHRRWIYVKRLFYPIYPGTPGYEEAVYESADLTRLKDTT